MCSFSALKAFLLKALVLSALNCACSVEKQDVCHYVRPMFIIIFHTISSLNLCPVEFPLFSNLNSARITLLQVALSKLTLVALIFAFSLQNNYNIQTQVVKYFL